jgi:hypothetical protein
MANPPESDLPDDALVVRGGSMESIRQVEASVATNRQKHGTASLSVFASVDLDVAEIVRQARSHDRYLPHGRLQTTTSKRLRDAGLQLIPSPPPPAHYSLMVPDAMMNDEGYDAIIRASDAPVPNPLGRMHDVPPSG